VSRENRLPGQTPRSRPRKPFTGPDPAKPPREAAQLRKPVKVINDEPADGIAPIAIGSRLIVDQVWKGLWFAIAGNQGRR
jgi:hypothetical protein